MMTMLCYYSFNYLYNICIFIILCNIFFICNSDLIHISPITYTKEYSNDLNALYHYHSKTSKVWDDKLYLKLSNDCYNTTAFRPYKCFNRIQVTYGFIIDGKLWNSKSNKIYRNSYSAIESKSIDCNYYINQLTTNNKNYIKFNINSNCTNNEPYGGSHFEIFSLSMSENINHNNDKISLIKDNGILSHCHINDMFDSNYIITCPTTTSDDSTTTCAIINGYIFYEHYDAVSDTLGNISI